MEQKIKSFEEISNNFDDDTRDLKKKMFVERIHKEMSIHAVLVARSGHWINKGWRSRNIWTPWGWVTIWRYIYMNVHTGKYEIPFDKVIGLTERIAVPEMWWPYIVSKLPLATSYKALSELFGFELSATMISNIVKKSELYFKPVQLAEKTKQITINIDGVAILMNKKKRSGEMKFATIHTHVERTGKKKRNALLNKVMIPFRKDWDITTISILLCDYVKFIYGKVEKIRVVGDGAGWIDTIAAALKSICNDVERSIDVFHFSKWIKDLVGIKTKLNWRFIRDSSRKECEQYLIELASSKFKDKYGLEALKLHEKKLLKKAEKIGRFKTKFNKTIQDQLINVAECIQSHNVATLINYRRSFSIKNSYKVMMIKAARYNSWTIWNKWSDEDNYVSVNDPYVTIDSLVRNDKATNVPNTRTGSPITDRYFLDKCHG